MSHQTHLRKIYFSVIFFFALIAAFSYFGKNSSLPDIPELITEQTKSLQSATLISAFRHPLSGEQDSDHQLPHPAAQITPAQAKTIAVNAMKQTADGVQLRHRRHDADFKADGLHFKPRRGNLDWHWQLTSVGTESTLLSEVQQGSVAPEIQPAGSRTVEYDRGGVIEQYVARVNKIEQQFVIPERLQFDHTNLVIRGTVASAGQFKEISTQDDETIWEWRSGVAVVSLGDVTVFDATGAELPATMQVTANETRIAVDGLALASAAYPVTIDPEIGANDFRISDMGSSSDEFDALEPAVAYNSTDNEYLVVWYGDINSGTLVDEELEIFGQRVDAATGAEVGVNDFRISDMGPDGDPAFGIDFGAPAVAYNSADNEYLVVWQGDDDTAPLVDEEFEIFGQRIAGATGAEVGVNDFRISDMGPNGNTSFDALAPAVAYNSSDNEYLVVWHGDDDIAPLVIGEFEIFGQRLDATPASFGEIGVNDFRISDMGPDGNTLFDAFDPAVAYNSSDNEYLVVWEGDDDSGLLADNELEIYGQRLDATPASFGEIGVNDFRISDMGPDGDASFDAFDPAVAYNNSDNEYLVVWQGDDNTAPLVVGELEIFGQRLDATPASFGEVGTNDFRISDMGPDGSTSFRAEKPAVAYNSSDNEYLVVWTGDDNSGLLVDDEFEIFGQRLDATPASFGEIGVNDFRMSDMGPDGTTSGFADDPMVAYNSGDNEYLVVWEGDEAIATNSAVEIYGQRLDATPASFGEVGSNDFLISDIHLDGDPDFFAIDAAVAYNSSDNEYLVVWEGVDDSGTLVEGEREIFGQRLDAATGVEVGVNDFRISDMGPDGDASFDALDPAVAYNSSDNEYLVVWEGDDDSGLLVDGEFEIYGQRLDATPASFGEIGANDFRISDMGPDGSTLFMVNDPAVAYNSRDNEYLVVWDGDDDTGPLVDNEREIFGQRLAGATGAEVGANDFRISDMGPDGSSSFEARSPAVAYNSSDNEYLVVWQGDDDSGLLVDQEFEIYGQRLDATPASFGEIGANDFRISDMGPDGSTSFRVLSPAVAYNSNDNEYLVVWSGDDDTAPLVDNEREIFGQRLDATPASFGEIGANDFRISDMGPNGSATFVAESPAVLYHSTENEYLVVWEGDDDSGLLVDEEFEIYGQRLDATPASFGEVGDNDFRLSDMGPDGSDLFLAFLPAVAYNSANNECLIVWEGSDNRDFGGGRLLADEFEIWGQRFAHPTVVTPPPSLPHDFVLLAEEEIEIDRQVDSEGNIHSNGEILFKEGDPSTHTGNLNAVEEIEIEEDNTIDGDVTSGGEVENEGTVTGTITEFADPGPLPLPSLSFSAGGRGFKFFNGVHTLEPGTYGKVIVKGKATLILTAGEYFVTQFRLLKKGNLIMNVEDGPITVNVVKRLDFDKKSVMEITPGDAATSLIRFNYLGSKKAVKIKGKARVLGTIVAPNAEVSLGKKARFKGAICAQSIEVKKVATFLHHSSLTPLPKLSPEDDGDDMEQQELTSIPTEFELAQNYPNPFNPSTTISFALPKAGEVTLSIYNLRGQLVNTVVSRPFAAGQHKVVWDGNDGRGLRAASGVYVYRLESKDFVATRKLVLTK